MSSDNFQQMLIQGARSIALELASPQDFIRKAIVELEAAKQPKDKMLVDENINQAIRYLELGIEKC